MSEEIQFSSRNLTLTGLHWNANKNAKVKMLALHGWLDNAESFSPLAKLLENIEIVALDFPGHGYSDHRPKGEILHYVDYIADVYQVLEQLDWQQSILMGHSMGAGIASIFTSAFGRRLQGLICLDGLGPITSDVDELPGRLNKAVRLNLNSTAKSTHAYQHREQAVAARMKAGDLSKASAQRLVQRNLKQVDQGFSWRSDSRLRLPSLYYLSEPQAVAYLKNIRIPTLMIRPVDSAYRAQQLLKQRAGLIRNLTWYEVPGAHHVHMDDPLVIIKPITEFIDALEIE